MEFGACANTASTFRTEETLELRMEEVQGERRGEWGSGGVGDGRVEEGGMRSHPKFPWLSLREQHFTFPLV